MEKVSSFPPPSCDFLSSRFSSPIALLVQHCVLSPSALEELPDSSPHSPTLVHFVYCVFLECGADPVTVFCWPPGAFLPICHDSCWTLFQTPYHSFVNPPLHPRRCWGTESTFNILSGDEGTLIPWALSGCLENLYHNSLLFSLLAWIHFR